MFVPQRIRISHSSSNTPSHVIYVIDKDKTYLIDIDNFSMNTKINFKQLIHEIIFGNMRENPDKKNSEYITMLRNGLDRKGFKEKVYVKDSEQERTCGGVIHFPIPFINIFYDYYKENRVYILYYYIVPCSNNNDSCPCVIQ